MKVQRLRLRLTLGPAAAQFSHHDIVRAIEDTCRDAGIAVAYSEGKRPAPQISLAAPLPQGVLSDCELADVFLADRIGSQEFTTRLRTRMPDGLGVVEASEVGLGGPSLQALLRWAEYEANIPAAGLSPNEVEGAISRLLLVNSLPSEYRRENKVRHYDLRPLILDVRLGGERSGLFQIAMRLCAEPERTARADQVLIALGLPQAVSVLRRRLYLDENQPAILAQRRSTDRDSD